MKSHRERHEMIYNRHENDDGSHGLFHYGGYNFMTCQKSTFRMIPTSHLIGGRAGSGFS